MFCAAAGSGASPRLWNRRAIPAILAKAEAGLPITGEEPMRPHLPSIVRHRPPSRSFLLAACAGLVPAVSQRALAQDQPTTPAPTPAPEAPARIDDGQRRAVSSITIRYVRDNPGHPAPGELLNSTVELAELEDGYAAPRLSERPDARIVTLRLADLATLDKPYLYDSTLPLLAPAVVARMQHMGYIGIFVEPDPEQFTVVAGKVIDLRAPEDTSLTLLVTTGVVTGVRTVGMGDFLPEADRINNPVHERIIRRSPVAPWRAQDAYADPPRPRKDLLRRDLIDDHVFRLNRRPGRRVDVAVAPTGEEFGGVTLDYIVTENRPWFLYAQAANNGTSDTGDWRERFGFVHNQLTRNDDIFSIDYVTSGFEDVHSITTTYEAPVGDSERWRWKAFGNWNEYTASDVGFAGADFTGRGWYAGGQVIWNFFQSGDFFLDAVAGARWQRVEVDNELADVTGEEDFVLPFVGVKLERFREYVRTSASLTLEGGFTNGSNDEIDDLGRADVDSDFATIQFDAAHSFYLEPLFNPDLATAGSLAHEISISAFGQVSLGDRLAPNFQQIAGGLYTVRGYPEAVAVGDSVFIGTLEYRWHIPKGMSPDSKPGEFFGRPFRYVPQFQYGPTDWDLIFRAFVDFGRTVNVDRLPFEQDQTLVGSGIGMELVLTRHFSARVDWGFALRSITDDAGDDVDAGDNEVHLVFTLVF